MNKQVGNGSTVGKALVILDLVADFEKPVRFKEIFKLSPYPKATLYRFLRTLTNQNMLQYDPELGTYSLGGRLVRLAYIASLSASLAPLAKKYTEALATETGETVHLAQIDNGHVLFVDKLKANPRVETLARVGMVAPAYCTGVGKAMLAFMAPKQLELALRKQSFFGYTPNTKRSVRSVKQELKVIRKCGIAYDREEHEEGIISIATPILVPTGRLIGAISIATSTARRSLTGLDEFRPSLLETSRKIGEEAKFLQLQP